MLVRFYAWVDQREANFIKVSSEAIRLLKTALDDEGIEMPEPIYRVRLVNVNESQGRVEKQRSEAKERVRQE